MIIGIDLGTTNSLAAYWQDGQSHLIPNALGHVMTPSVVSLDDDNALLIGQTAKERLITHPHLSISSFKRIMGTQQKITLGKHHFSPEELSSFILRSLKEDAEKHLDQPITEAVITVPAYFNDQQRRATQSAGTLAGLHVKRILNEPTAAALAYGLHQHHDDEEGKIIVLDLGGGTFDVSIIDVFDGIMEVRASAGDNFLGGNDFDDAIVEWFCQQTHLPLPNIFSSDLKHRNNFNYLRAAAEKARRHLDTHDSAFIEVTIDEEAFSAHLTTNMFNQLCAPLLARLTTPLRRALNDARILPEKISSLVLAGGGTRMPIVRKTAAKLLESFPLYHLNADHVVALGAAVQAGLAMRDAALSDIVLTDVAPYTLGIAVVDTHFSESSQALWMSPIIERNRSVPISRTQTFQPVSDYQTSTLIRIFQGEHRLVDNNILLGKIELMLPPGKKNEQIFDVRFTYTIDGLLEVVAYSRTGEFEERIVIEQHSGNLSLDDIEQRLEELNHLKIPPRDQAENRQILAQAERLYMEYTGEKRKEIGNIISYFHNALQYNKYDLLEEITPQIKQILSNFENTGVLR